METIRTVLALAAQLELKMFQLDVKSAFLNGELEEAYVEQPQGTSTKKNTKCVACAKLYMD